jgi:hypothetical protein
MDGATECDGVCSTGSNAGSSGVTGGKSVLEILDGVRADIGELRLREEAPFVLDALLFVL